MASMVFPQIDYGQKDGAWNPASSGPVYQKMEKARFDADFALLFCMDILFGKERSGDRVYIWEYVYEYGIDEDGNEVVVGGHWTQPKVKTKGSKGDGWLYNDNTLNAAKSGVPRMFGPPVSRSGTSWLYAVPCTTGSGGGIWSREASGSTRPDGVPQFTFVLESALEGDDTQYTRLLDAGHVAFAATDHYGTTVLVPYALGWEPVKQRRGRPECGNSKASPIGSFYR